MNFKFNKLKQKGICQMAFGTAQKWLIGKWVGGGWFWVSWLPNPGMPPTSTVWPNLGVPTPKIRKFQETFYLGKALPGLLVWLAYLVVRGLGDGKD